MSLSDGTELSQQRFDKMHTWSPDDSLSGWMAVVRQHGVYFSEPLDLDMAMLAAFPKAYKATIPSGGGPKMKPEDAAKAVLGEAGPGLTVYTGPYNDFVQHMPAYRYHFLGHSKPATHLRALAHLSEEKLETGMPANYRELFKHISDHLNRD